MTKRALITGVTGQDGAYLAKFLIEKGYDVYGTYRRLSSPNFWRLGRLGILDKITLIPFDLVDTGSIAEAIKISDPDEVYNLAAQSFVGASFDQPVQTCEVTGLGVVRILECIRQSGKKIKFYQASTSELYGDGQSGTLNEDVPFCPSSPYAAAKLLGYWQTALYRQAYGMYCCNGILFNHESPLRGLEFVTRKITNAVAKIHLGLETELHLGNLDSKRDWGFAPEYVECMWLMLQQDKPDDYVIATDETHSVRELVEYAFATVGLDWKKYVKVDEKLIRPVDVNYLKGDYSKARKVLNWEPKTKFKELVELMVKEDVECWKKWQSGESFSWDAPNYPENINIVTRSREK